MQVVKRENLTVVTRTYKDQQGQEKKVWKTIGEQTTFQGDDGSKFKTVELYHMPGVRISVFEQREREQSEIDKKIDEIPF